MELFWVGMLIGAGVVIVAIRGRAQLGGLRPLIERHVLASGAPSESTVPVEVVEQLRHHRPRRRLLHHYRDLLLDDVYTSLRRYAVEQRSAPTPGNIDHKAEGWALSGRCRLPVIATVPPP